MKALATSAWFISQLFFQVEAHGQNYSDTTRTEFSAGAIYKTETGEGVGIMYRTIILQNLSFRLRADALFAQSPVMSEFNYVELRPGLSRDLPLKKIIMYLAVDAFYGYFQNAIDKKIAHHQIGICGVVGIKTQPLFDNISIGIETGPKVAQRFQQTPDESVRWDNNILNDIFLYLTFRF
jgi:hypothetical protein